MIAALKSACSSDERVNFRAGLRADMSSEVGVRGVALFFLEVLAVDVSLPLINMAFALLLRVMESGGTA